jgi:NADH-quinone oxidoreductase subunit A
MKEYIILLIIVAIILNIIIKLNKLKLDREKITIYECGFQEFDSPRKKFYLKFYLVALIFLIFDLESLFVYPLSIYISNLTI